MSERIPQHLESKRNELIWALSQQKEFIQADVAKIMNREESTISRILKKMPEDWETKWKKIR